MNPEMESYEISTDRARLDLGFIGRVLAGSYWAQDRPHSVVEKSIRNSHCFGIYEKRTGRQVGFARVVTDGATIAWLGDVIVDDAHRGKGLGKSLMANVVEFLERNGTTCVLATRDAQGLYEKYGFVRTEYMKRTLGAQAVGPGP
ncbi:MAG TPA: GNAT family N-acetyltransferase [Opitutaceae bacterium]|jgi:predicted GNAT family N-acyltransferase